VSNYPHFFRRNQQKTRITALNVAVAQLTSTLLLPIIWILIGTIAVWLLVGTEKVSDNIASPVYYLILILCYYLGLKYSFNYVSKNLVVTQPNKSAKISSFLFYFGLMSIYLGFYLYNQEHNYLRVIAYFIIAYLFTSMTNKYFSSLEPDNRLNEYSFLIQVGFTIVNISLVIMLAILTLWLMIEYPLTQGLYFMVLAFWMGDYGTKINNFLFVPYFYQDGESYPYKKVMASLLLSIPINIFLFYMISMGALTKV